MTPPPAPSLTLPLTPSQTAGPFFGIGLPWPDGPYVVPEGTPDAITIASVTGWPAPSCTEIGRAHV